MRSKRPDNLQGNFTYFYTVQATTNVTNKTENTVGIHTTLLLFIQNQIIYITDIKAADRIKEPNNSLQLR